MSETKATKPYPLRIPKNLMELAEAKSRSERTDRAMAEGCISSGKAAELLDTTVHRVHELARDHGVEIGAGLEDYRRSRESTAGLLG